MKSNRPILLAAAALALAALAAYHNSFAVPFTFDDLPSILDNPSLRQWSTAFSPPKGFGFTVSGRPVLNATLALNQAVSGTNVWSYHALNLLIHVLAGLTLFGLVRRTLLLGTAGGALRPDSPNHRGVKPLLQGNALAIAFVTALLWTLHPLQAEAVTYVIQRAESLMGLFYLLMFYCFARSLETVQPGPWRTGAIVAGLIGAGCKEVIATAPLLVLLYDRTFAAGSFGEVWRSRRWFHAGLMLTTWLPLAWLVLGTGGDRGGTFSFTAEAAPSYWLIQFEAVARYLQLSVWPAPLVFDYGFFTVRDFSAVALPAVVVLALLALTVWALWKKPVAGFLGAWFFLILAPTSIMPGIQQVIVEHRVYLSLAAVVALVVGGGVAWLGRRGLVLFIALAVVAGGLTEWRNRDYQTDLQLWGDTVRKRPTSAAAQCNLGTAYYNRGDSAAALPHFAEAVRLAPEGSQNQYNLGLALDKSGRVGEAITHYREAVRLLPYFAQAQARLGADLVTTGKYDEALLHLKVALTYIPEMAEAYNSVGKAMVETGQLPKAVAAYKRALKQKPDYADAEANLGAVLVKLNQPAEAVRHLQRALALAPGQADAHYNLGLVHAAAGRPEEAFAHYAEAVRLDPAHAEARLNLGVMFAQQDKLAEALAQLQEVVRLRPGLAEAHANLGIVLAQSGRGPEAVQSYETALKLRPDYATAHYNLGNALVQQQRWTEARRHFAEAVRLAPDFAAAREMLERLRDAPDGGGAR